MKNNIGINNVSNMNFNKKNAYGIDYTSYIVLPIILFTVVITLMVGLKLVITRELIPN